MVVSQDVTISAARRRTLGLEACAGRLVTAIFCISFPNGQVDISIFDVCAKATGIGKGSWRQTPVLYTGLGDVGSCFRSFGHHLDASHMVPLFEESIFFFGVA